MRNNESEMQEHNENKYMEELKKQLEEEPVPTDLYPSKMKEKLLAHQEAGTSKALGADSTADTAGAKAALNAEDGVLSESLKSESRKNRSLRTYLTAHRRWMVAFACLAVFFIALAAWGISGYLLPLFQNTGMDGAADGEIEIYETDLDTAAGAAQSKSAESTVLAQMADISFAESYDQLYEYLYDNGKTAYPNWGGYATLETATTKTAESAYDTSSTLAGATADGAADSGEAYSYDESEVSDAASQSSDDVSETNTQEEAVDEADIIKTDGTFIYILQENEEALRVVRADDGVMTECANYIFQADDAQLTQTVQEMYVDDGKVTIITQYEIYHYYDSNFQEITEEEAWQLEEEYWAVYEEESSSDSAEIADDSEETSTDSAKIADNSDDSTSESNDISTSESSLCYYTVVEEYVVAETLAVSEDGALTSLGSITQSGSYTSSRKSGDYIYLFTDYDVQILHEDSDITEEYVPQINGTCVPADSVALPDCGEEGYNYYIVSSSFSIQEPGTCVDQFSVLTDGYYTQQYVSAQAIYFMVLTDEAENTQILKYTYTNGQMTAQGAQKVKGTINNSFSLSEYNGYLRLVTTYDYGENTETVKEYDGESVTSITIGDWKTYNALYVLDENMELTGIIDNIAEDETIKSARFMGDVGYFVTYEETDPLFSVDLSDPANPQIMGELEIPGFSTYLHIYGDGLLLGFGYDENENLKLTMFDISAPYQVQEENTCQLIQSTISGQMIACYSEALYNHKAMLISTVRNLIGFSAEVYAEGEHTYYTKYFIYGYEEDGFYEQFSYTSEDCEQLRAVYIGDVLYVCEWRTEEGEVLTAFDMANGYSKLGQLTLEKTCTDSYWYAVE